MYPLPGMLIAAAAAVCWFVPGLSAAQSFKAPIKVIVPYAAGGGTDVVARLLAPGLSRELGQNVVIDNKPGASGQIGTQLFIGFFAPKGLPAVMAQEFNAALRKSLADPAVLDKIRQMSLQPAPTTLEEAVREVDEISRFWKAALAPKR